MRVVLRQAMLIAVKDTRIFFKDKFAVGFAFLFPFLFVIGFSLALGGQGPEDEPLQMVLATQEGADSISGQMVGALADGVAGGQVEVMEYEEALDAVQSGELNGFVAFPSGFSGNLMSGVPTTVEVVVGNGSPETQAALYGFARSVASELSRGSVAFGTIGRLSATEAIMLPPTFGPSPDDFVPVVSFEVERVGDIEPFQPSNFTLPAYLTMFLFFTAALSAEAIARERQSHTLERLVSNGTRRESVIVGKFAGIAFRGVAQLGVMWAVGIVAFGIDLGASPGAVIIISVLMALASATFGVMLGSFVSNVQAASAAGPLVALVLAPIGGCWWPLFITPQWMQSLAKLTLHGWANGGFNKLMLFGAEFGDVTQEMMALAGFGVVFMAVALWRFRMSAAAD
ncbi:MAG: ABC transporter permease [Dehalococcoidia bacterium]|nr:ABC transporter permease [Dehalococcoidia bacterium]